MSGNWHCPATPCIVVLYVYGAEDRKTKYNVQVRSGSMRVTSVCVLTRYGNRAMMPSARRSLPDRHHLCPPSAAWRPLTIASPRTIPSRDAANSVSVLYFCVPYHSSSPSRRLTTRPHYLLILISRTFSVLWSFSLSFFISHRFAAQIMSTNATCFTPKAPEKGPSLFQHGKVVFQGMWDMMGAISLSTPHVFLDSTPWTDCVLSLWDHCSA